MLALDEGSGEPETITKLAPYFGAATRGPVAPLLRGADTISVRRIWILSGYRGGWPIRADR